MTVIEWLYLTTYSKHKEKQYLKDLKNANNVLKQFLQYLHVQYVDFTVVCASSLPSVFTTVFTSCAFYSRLLLQQKTAFGTVDYWSKLTFFKRILSFWHIFLSSEFQFLRTVPFYIMIKFTPNHLLLNVLKVIRTFTKSA